MPRPHHPTDPFTTAPLQPTTSNSTSLRTQSSQHSLRSNASTASTRPRPQNNLFAPALSRRPTSRATPRVDDEVLADSESETEQHPAASSRQRPLRRLRNGSPSISGAGKQRPQKVKQEDEVEFVNRRADGSFLLGVSGFGQETAVPDFGEVEGEEERDQAEADAHYVSIARQYFSSGAALGGKGGKRHEEGEFESVELWMGSC